MIFKMYVSTNLCSLFDYLYWPLWPVLGIVVQLVTTMLLQGGSCGFEPRQSQLIQWFESFPLLKFCLVCLTFNSFATNSILLSHKFAQFNLILWGQCVSVNKIFFQCWMCMCVCFVCCIVVWHVILCIIKYTIAKIQIIIGFPLKIYPWSH